MRRLALAAAAVVAARLMWRWKPVRRATYGATLWACARLTPQLFDQAIRNSARRNSWDEKEVRAILARHRILVERG